MATLPFGKIFGFMSGQSLGTRVSNLKFVALTVLELLAFDSHDRPLRTHTDRQTDRQDKHKRTHYLRHSLRSLGGDNYVCTSPTYMPIAHGTSTSQTDRQTDRQMDRRTTYHSNTALACDRAIKKNNLTWKLEHFNRCQ